MDVHNIDLTSAAFKRDPFPTFAKMRAIGPLLKVKLPFVGAAWVTSTYQAAVRILRDKESFVSDPKNAGKRNVAGMTWWMPRMIRVLTQNMLQKDEPDHRRLRTLVESAFVKQSVESLRPRIAELASEHLECLWRASAGGANVDFLEHFARPFPLAVIGELLGLPTEDRAKFLKWASRMTTASSAIGLLKGLPGLWKLTRYFRRQFAECRRQPRPGMLSALVAAEQEGDRLSEDELLASAFVLLFAGHETTVHLLANSVLCLEQHPDQKAKLVNDWSLARSAVDEVLRYACPVQMTKPRYAARDMVLFEQQIRQGEVFMPIFAAANCDPEKFTEPERFDVTRDPNPHLGFGTGIHVCLGLKLAMAEAEIALEQLYTRFPNLSPVVDGTDIAWNECIGMRAMLSFPLSLNGAARAAA